MFAFEKSIESEYFFFNDPIIFPISLMLEAPDDSIISLHIFFVSTSDNCFGRKASIILISSSSTFNNSSLPPFLYNLQNLVFVSSFFVKLL